jgi:PadR family transcriptional regulator, regulatory protein PadR
VGERLRRTPAFMAVLAAVAAGRTYGYKVTEVTGLASGTVYPLLERFEAQGWVISGWSGPEGRGPRKRFYEITEQGRKALTG